MKLPGKTALVTGAGSGIGRAVSMRFAKEGAAVAVTDLKLENAETVAAEIRSAGGKAYAYKADATKSEEVKQTVLKVLGEFGHIDILVNNAGGSAGLFGKLGKFKDSTEDVWTQVIDLNLLGTMRFTRELINQMLERKSGNIINIASIAAEVGIIDRVDYSAAKGGVVAMSKALAMEVGPYGVKINCISPGLISRTGTINPTEGTYVGREGSPEEVASLAAFLASPEADFITGVNYIIDGGRTLGPTGL